MLRGNFFVIQDNFFLPGKRTAGWNFRMHKIGVVMVGFADK